MEKMRGMCQAFQAQNEFLNDEIIDMSTHRKNDAIRLQKLILARSVAISSLRVCTWVSCVVYMLTYQYVDVEVSSAPCQHLIRPSMGVSYSLHSSSSFNSTSMTTYNTNSDAMKAELVKLKEENLYLLEASQSKLDIDRDRLKAMVESRLLDVCNARYHDERNV
jgi:hypothetical protein